MRDLFSIGGRLKQYRDILGLNQKEFSERYGITQQSLSKYENDSNTISDDLKTALCVEGLNLNWLLTGESEMLIKNAVIPLTDFFEVPLLTKDEVLALIPIREKKARTGEYPNKILVPVGDRIKEFSTDLRAIRVFNSRMEPILNSGDIALFEASGWNGNNGVYLYKNLGELHFSRISYAQSTSYVITHESPDVEVPVYDAQTFEAIGRIRAVLKEVL